MQCPLMGYPHGRANTVDDIKEMIIEQNITFWAQLAPESEYGVQPPTAKVYRTGVSVGRSDGWRDRSPHYTYCAGLYSHVLYCIGLH